MKNENLVSLADRPESERKEIARKGGIKSGESRKRAKTIRETFGILLSSETMNKSFEFMEYDVPDEDKNHMTLMCVGLIRAEKQGNVKAFEKIMDIMNEEK